MYASVVFQAPVILTRQTLYVCENYANTFLILNYLFFILKIIISVRDLRHMTFVCQVVDSNLKVMSLQSNTKYHRHVMFKITYCMFNN